MAVKYVPKKSPVLSACVAVKDANAFADFAAKTFGGEVSDRFMMPDGSLGHAAVKFGDGSQVMVSESCKELGVINGGIWIYVPDVDEAYTNAMEQGSKSIMEPEDQFWGDRSSGLRDRWGNTWWIATHIEDVSPAEMQKRGDEFMKKNAGKK